MNTNIFNKSKRTGLLLRDTIVKTLKTKSITMKLCVLCVLILFSSCKKNQLGGKSVIQGKVIHHSKRIANATVFIKYNAKEFPGTDTTLYDDKVRADKDGNYTMKCYKGNYYLFGFGRDSAIAAPYIVIGGTPVHIRHNETLDIDVAVTEGD
ncbi:MAG: hypothetical protein KF900_09280 [Bacteroidetes bacterium]|nr:hypothetical protein [Bacteroidota bacterium]